LSSGQTGNFRQKFVTHVGHARFPAIIFPNGQEYITAIGSQGSSKKLCTDPDIEVLGDDDKSTRKFCALETHDFLAVAVRGTFTLVFRNLHEALLSGATNGRRVAAAFLHREGSKYDRRD
jgi:hypothetical protein